MQSRLFLELTDYNVTAGCTGGGGWYFRRKSQIKPSNNTNLCGHHEDYTGSPFEMASSASVNFISLVTSCVGLQEEEPQTALPHVIYMGVSYSR